VRAGAAEDDVGLRLGRRGADGCGASAADQDT
jgi:hypothetical protein